MGIVELKDDESVGLDLDGVFHDSNELGFIALNQAFRENGLPEITMDQMRRHFHSDWPRMYRGLKLPPEMDDLWKTEYQRCYDCQPLGPLIEGTHEALDYLLTKYSTKRVRVVTNELPERVHRLFRTHKLHDMIPLVRSAPSGKSRLFEQENIGAYAGDTVSDFDWCRAAANKPHFIGVADDKVCFNYAWMLYDLEEAYVNERITIVGSLRELKDVL